MCADGFGGPTAAPAHVPGAPRSAARGSGSRGSTNSKPAKPPPTAGPCGKGRLSAGSGAGDGGSQPPPHPLRTRLPRTGCGRWGRRGPAPGPAPGAARRELLPGPPGPTRHCQARGHARTATAAPAAPPPGARSLCSPDAIFAARELGRRPVPRRPVPAAPRAPIRARPRGPGRRHGAGGARSPERPAEGARPPWPAGRAPRLQRRRRTLGTRPPGPAGLAGPPTPALDRPPPAPRGPEAAGRPRPLRAARAPRLEAPPPAHAHWPARCINIPRWPAAAASRAPIGSRAQALPRAGRSRAACRKGRARGAASAGRPLAPRSPGCLCAPTAGQGRLSWGVLLRAELPDPGKGPRLLGGLPGSRLFCNARLPTHPRALCNTGGWAAGPCPGVQGPSPTLGRSVCGPAATR